MIKLASIINVDTDKQRIDSVHIKSNMRRLGRISILSSTIHKFLINLNRHYLSMFTGKNTKQIILSNLIMLSYIFLVSLIQACGKKVIEGQVIDAYTRKPIDGATIAITWRKDEFFGIPGLSGPGGPVIESFEVLSGPKGEFGIPKYYGISYYYRMGIYKRGFFCWSSEKIFYPNIDTWLEIGEREKRKDNKYKIKNGMVIYLEPLIDGYSTIKHARFTDYVRSKCASYGGLFFNAMKNEYLFIPEYNRRNEK